MLAVLVVISIVLLVEVDRNGTLVAEAGGWPAPMGITLVADRFAALLLVVAEVMLLAVLVYAIGEPGAERNHVGFQSAYLVLAAGVAASFLTGDLFNLFVSFEMMLTASYVLLTLGGRREQVRSGMTYVVISLIASTLFVTALALLYSATGNREHGRSGSCASAICHPGSERPSRCCCSSCSASRRRSSRCSSGSPTATPRRRRRSRPSSPVS